MQFFSTQKSKRVHIIFSMSFLPQASKLICLYGITKDPWRVPQLARLLSDANSVAPPLSPEYHYKYQADTTWPPLAMP
jgi:hypothetical protein